MYKKHPSLPKGLADGELGDARLHPSGDPKKAPRKGQKTAECHDGMPFPMSGGKVREGSSTGITTANRGPMDTGTKVR